MSMIIDGTNGCTFPDTTVQTTTGKTGFVNRIINGSMVIDQRYSGALITSPTTYMIDRWNVNTNQSARLNARQNYNSVTPPAGFSNYLGIVSTGAATVGSTDYSQLQQNIEGFNTADLGWGTANAKTVTLSFWVYSSLTGTFSGSFRDASTYSYAYPFSYTISSANTWTYISITVPGPTAGIGTWGTTNGIGIQMLFNLGCGSTYLSSANSWQAGVYAGVTGSVNVVATNGATWYVTGVQLEKGSTATSFDYRPYGTELALCQRYFMNVPYAATGLVNTTTIAYIGLTFNMRAAVSIGTPSAAVTINDGVANYTQSSANAYIAATGNSTGVFIGIQNFTGLTVARPCLINTSVLIPVSAEL